MRDRAYREWCEGTRATGGEVETAVTVEESSTVIETEDILEVCTEVNIALLG